MPLVPCSVLVLHRDRSVRQRLIGAAYAINLVVEEVAGWDELRAATVAAIPGSLVAVDPFHGQADPTPAPALRELTAAFPGVPVLAAARFSRAHPDVALTLGRWGVTELLPLGMGPGGPRMPPVVERLHSRYFFRVVDAVLPRGQGNRLGWVLDLLTRLGAERIDVRGLARMLKVSPQALTERYHRVGLPTPGRLLTWCRVLLAADLLDNPGHTEATAARACGFAHPATFRNALHRLAGADLLKDVEPGQALAAVGARLAWELGAPGATPGNT